MSRGKNRVRVFLTLVFALAFGTIANAQVDSLVRVGDSLYRAYDFNAAVSVFNQALKQERSLAEASESSLLRSISLRLIQAENGRKMSTSVRTPKVVGGKMFSKEEFVLAYPLEDESWRKLPNLLDESEPDGFIRALFAPTWNDRLYFSAKDDTGTRSLYVTSADDVFWSVPRLVEEVSTPGSNDIFPMLSPDEKVLYFSSNSLNGLGGYDLYYSRWDDLQECWSTPQNMGFPFSSPDDDFLYVDSVDEKYSLFASTRDCPPDSVYVYVLQYDRSPVRTSVKDPKELYSLSRLKMDNVVENSSENAEKEKEREDLKAKYMSQMDAVRVLKDSIDHVKAKAEELKLELTFSNDDSKRYELNERILENESMVPVLQKNLEEAQVKLRQLEEDFLRKGVLDDKKDTPKGNDKNQQAEYVFFMNSFGEPLDMHITIPLEVFDYTFKVSEEAVFALDQMLPSGIVYQIHLFGGNRKSLPSELRGLSPVYETRSPSGMYVYRVGRFATYDEALENISAVQELGFHNAYICAFENGEEITVSKARTLQEYLKGGFALFEIKIMPDSGELNPRVMEIVSSEAFGKDILRTEEEDGTQVYTIGPFDSKEKAEALVTTLSKIMRGNVVCKPVNK